MERSMLDIAYELISKTKTGIKFNELFVAVCNEKGIEEDKYPTYIGRFYSDLSLDGRFVVLDDNIWDLRERYQYDNVHIEISEAYDAVAEDDGDEEDKADNQEYDASVQGLSVEDMVPENNPEEPKDGEEGGNAN